MSDYRKEFPDFDPATMPAIPAGFDDTSWKNDTCPSFTSERLGVALYVDFLDPEDREFPGPEVERFTLHETTGSPLDGMVILSTDDWNVVLQKIADLQGEMDRQAPPLEGTP